MPERRTKQATRRAGAVLVTAVACGGLGWGVVASGAGCQLKGSCDADDRTIPGLTAEPKGPPLGANGVPAGATMYGDAWQSSAIEGHWLWFPGQRTYTIDPGFPGPYEFVAYISADPEPYTTSGSNFAPSAGNPAEFSGLPDGGRDGFQVANGSCSPYYLWLRVTQEPVAVAPLTDAAADVSSSTDAEPGATPDAADARDARDATAD